MSCVFILSCQAFAFSIVNDINPVKDKKEGSSDVKNEEKKTLVKSATFRTFKELEAFDKKEIPIKAKKISEGYAFTNDSIREKQWMDKANAAFAEIETSQNFIEYLTPDDLGQLPIGISKSIGNIKYTVSIAKAVLKPVYAEFTAF